MLRQHLQFIIGTTAQSAADKIIVFKAYPSHQGITQC